MASTWKEVNKLFEKHQVINKELIDDVYVLASENYEEGYEDGERKGKKLEDFSTDELMEELDWRDIQVPFAKNLAAQQALDDFLIYFAKINL